MQADKEQASREGHTSSDVVQRLCMIHLEVADHHQARSIGTACDERCGINPGMTTLLQELMRGISSRVQQVLGPPCSAGSGEQDSL